MIYDMKVIYIYIYIYIYIFMSHDTLDTVASASNSASYFSLTITSLRASLSVGFTIARTVYCYCVTKLL